MALTIGKMDEYIKREDAIDICTKCVDFQDSIENINASAEAMRIRRLIKELLPADVVERKVLDQVYWERDTALHQLAEIGKGLGEKMDDVVCLDLSPICVGCDGKTVDGKTTDLCDYKTTYKRCFEQGKKLVDIAKAYFNGELVKRKHGKWERHNDGIMYWWDCSECHHDAWYDEDDLYNFCPYCGSDMREEK